MPWKVKFSNKAEKQLGKLESKYQVIVFETLTILQKDPRKLPRKTLKKLRGKPGYRIRVGDVRIKVKFKGDSIEVFFIGLKDDRTYK